MVARPALDEVLDGPSATRSYWTTVNASEGIPGVATPLTWWWYGDASEYALRKAFFNIGAMRASIVPVPSDSDERLLQVFLGRCALNVDNFRRMADRMPGGSGDSFEEQFFGCVRPGVESHKTWRRYPTIAVRAPLAAVRFPREIVRMRREYHRWWSTRTADVHDMDLGAAVALFREAHERFSAMLPPHITCSYLTQGIYEQVDQLCERAGRPDLPGTVTAGFGSMEETVALRAIWELARGLSAGTVTDIVDEHGYTGPGELAQRSWRENPRLVESLLDRYRSLPESKGPSKVEVRQRITREKASRELLSALPATRRPGARVVLRLAQTFLPLREVGRAIMVMSVDVGRAAARVVGGHLSACGALDAPEDVFFLTGDELAGQPDALPLRKLVAQRKARREYYGSVDLPETWTGIPTPRVGAEPDVSPDPEVSGIGVNGQAVTGRVRVIFDPDEADDFEPGEVLVCPITDPSWVSLFYLASAVVVDMGGPMSHGAIVARELGVPCVVNTKDGTRRLATGQIVRVDPLKGTVTPSE